MPARAEIALAQSRKKEGEIDSKPWIFDMFVFCHVSVFREIRKKEEAAFYLKDGLNDQYTILRQINCQIQYTVSREIQLG